MAAQSPRFTREQVQGVGPTGVTFTSTEGNERIISLVDLSNVELNRACSIKFPAVNGKAWFGVSKDAKIVSLQTGTVPDGLPMAGETVFETKTKQAEGDTFSMSGYIPTEEKDEHVFEAKIPEAKEIGSGGKVESAITDLIASVAGSIVDEDAVRRIAADVLNQNVAELLAEATRPQVNKYAFQGKAEVTIEGRTHEVLPKVLRSLATGHHVWLVGPAGTGKSTIAKHAAEAMGLGFYSISCHGQMTAAQVFGYMNASGEYVPSLFRVAFENGGLFLFDEIDSASSNVLAAVNQALANGTCAFPDGMVEKSDGFYCVGAGNTFGKGATAEYSGRAKIDEATIDRFDYLYVGYDQAIEREMTEAILGADADAWLSRIAKYREAIETHGLKAIMGTRTVIGGAELLAAGAPIAEVLEMRVFRGMGTDLRSKIGG